MNRRHLGRAGAVTALIAPLLAFLASTSLAVGAAGPATSDPSHDPRLPDSRDVLASGEVDADGNCHIEIPRQGTRQGFVEVGSEISFNEAACTSLYSIAVYPIDKVPTSVQERVFGGAAEYQDFAEEPAAELTGSLEPVQSSDTVGDVGIMATHSAKLMIAYRDPLFIHVTRTTTTLNWSTAPPCVLSASSAHEPYMAGNTGWIRTYYLPTKSVSCSQAKADTAAYFQNDPFCPGSYNTTYTQHKATRVYGMPSGGSDWYRSMSKSGGCNDLLHTTYAWTP